MPSEKTNTKDVSSADRNPLLVPSEKTNTEKRDGKPDTKCLSKLQLAIWSTNAFYNLVISSCRFNACVRRRKQASQSASTKCLPVAWESKGTKASPLSSRLPWNCGNHRGNPTVSTRSAVVPSRATRPRSSRRLSCWKMNPPGG